MTKKQDDGEAERLVSNMMAAAATGDYDALRAYYTPDATFWINITGKTLGLDDQLASVKGMRGRASNVEYVDVRVTPFEGGFVQQHRAIGDLNDGTKLEVHACFVCRTRDGKVYSREEYLDSAALTKVRG